MRNYLTVLTMALLSSCTIRGRMEPPKGHDWELDTTTLTITSDADKWLDIRGEKIPEGIEWYAIPSGVISCSPYNGGKSCSFGYLQDGYGEIIATDGERVQKCKFISKYLSDTGLHLLINGTDTYFPMIGPNGEGDGITKITRVYSYTIPRDTIRIWIVDFIPEQTRNKIIVKNIYLYDDKYRYQANAFSRFGDPFRINGSTVSYMDSSPNFDKICGGYIEQLSYVMFDDTECVTLEINTNGFENGFGENCCFRIRLIGSG